MNETETKSKSQKQKSPINSIIIVFILTLLGMLAFFLLYKGVIWVFDYEHSGVHWSFHCEANMTRLGQRMWLYAKENNDQYPTADKWCDVLIEYELVVDERIFQCKGIGKGRCNFAINPKAEPNSPSDIVLLFESPPGWNQFGGPEVLTTENHKGKGCNILFNGLHTEFVKTEQLGELKWGNEKEK